MSFRPFPSKLQQYNHEILYVHKTNHLKYSWNQIGKTLHTMKWKIKCRWTINVRFFKQQWYQIWEKYDVDKKVFYFANIEYFIATIFNFSFEEIKKFWKVKIWNSASYFTLHFWPPRGPKKNQFWRGFFSPPVFTPKIGDFLGTLVFDSFTFFPEILY